MLTPIKELLQILLNPRYWGYGLFWSWNLIFLTFMAFGFAPNVLPEMLVAVQTQVVPPSFLIYALILTLIPAIAVLLGLTVLRKEPGRLFLLGYGVEGPLMLMLAIRFFVVREMTPGVALLLSIAGLGMATLLWQILDRKIDSRGPLLTRLRVLGLTLLLFTSIYAAIWIAFYAVPLSAHALRTLGEIVRDLPSFWQEVWMSLVNLFTNEWRWIPFIFLGLSLFFYSATLFVLMPIAVPWLSLRAWWSGMCALVAKAQVPRLGWLVAGATTVVTLTICVSLFALTNQQPQGRAFALLETPPATLAEAQVLVEQEDAIRAGLLNAYLAPQRYVSAVGEVIHVRQMFAATLNLPEEQTRQIQQLYEVVASPILYQPVKAEMVDASSDNRSNNLVIRNEQIEAARRYAEFFDQPIQKGEHEAVVRAVRSTWSVEQAEAGWLAVDDREVHLARQEVTISEHGDWAEGELYEVYQNKTGQRQEVVYYFSLPESAVVTGVWLGDSPDRDQRFVYRVSPRGAAQAMYRNEVQRQIDPALVEQIGPRQYRLRIFPIEPLRTEWEAASGRTRISEGPALHLWLTWRVFAQEGGWPLPRLAEKRNIYWDADSVRLVNGEAMAARADEWVPATVPATTLGEPVAHRFDFPGGDTVLARPVTAADLPAPAAGIHLAAVLDRSRSMASYAGDVAGALERLSQLAAAGATVDLYLTSSPYRGEEPALVELATVDPTGIFYYGGQNAAELLAQFDELRGDRHYDAVVVLTDGSGYELGSDGVSVPVPDAPVWLVHLGGALPLGYDDATLDAIQASGGGVTGNLEDALVRLSFAVMGENEQATGYAGDLVDGYLWSTIPTAELAQAEPDLAELASDDAFAALATRRLLLTELHRVRAQLDQLEALDQLHALAVEQSIVTPLSSMIVLVTPRQERMLDQLEARGDRFQREVEQVGDTLPENAFALTGVPEPEEWLLLALVAGMVVWFLRSSRRVQRPEYR
jgi:putative PEP-CTERM system integral membrane protein